MKASILNTDWEEGVKVMDFVGLSEVYTEFLWEIVCPICSQCGIKKQ
jgi:hypothetical protein